MDWIAIFDAVWFVGAIGLTIVASHAFDSLVRLEYEQFRIEWAGDDEPFGVFWHPEDGRFFFFDYRRRNAGREVFWRWLFSTPMWMRSEPRAMMLVRRLRLATLVYIATAFLLAILLCRFRYAL